MSQLGPIIVIDPDEDDRLFYKSVLDKVGYKVKVVHFAEAKPALQYSKETDRRYNVITKTNGLSSMR